MKGKSSIIEGIMRKTKKKNHYVIENCNFCISLREIYKNIPSSNLTENNFLVQTICLINFNTN